MDFKLILEGIAVLGAMGAIFGALLAFAVCCITVAELQKRCSGQCGALHDQHKKTAAR